MFPGSQQGKDGSTVAPFPVSHIAARASPRSCGYSAHLPCTPRAKRGRRGLHQRYPQQLPPRSMALEERLSSLKTAFDKWDRNNYHIQKTNQASQEI